MNLVKQLLALHPIFGGVFPQLDTVFSPTEYRRFISIESTLICIIKNKASRTFIAVSRSFAPVQFPLLPNELKIKFNVGFE